MQYVIRPSQVTTATAIVSVVTSDVRYAGHLRGNRNFTKTWCGPGIEAILFNLLVSATFVRKADSDKNHALPGLSYAVIRARCRSLAYIQVMRWRRKGYGTGLIACTSSWCRLSHTPFPCSCTVTATSRAGVLYHSMDSWKRLYSIPPSHSLIAAAAESLALWM